MQAFRCRDVIPSMETRPSFAPNLYFCDARLVGPLHAWPPLFERVAAWGFDHVLIGGLWAASRRGYPRHVADPDRPAESFATPLDATSALARLSDSAREHGLRVAVEVVVDRVAREHPLHDAHRAWYVVDERDDALIDPRTAALAHDVAHANVGSAAALDALADWWRARLGALADAGAAAFLVDAPQRMPAHWWAALLRALRQARADLPVIAGVPGREREALAQLACAGFDAAFSSLRWWDLRAPWFVEEHRLLRRVGAPIAFPDAFDGPRLAHDWRQAAPETIERAHRRALWTAAALGTGWLVPMGFERGVAVELMAREPRADAYRAALDSAPFDLSGAIAEANALRRAAPALRGNGEIAQLTGADAPATVLLRGARTALEYDDEAALIAVNPDLAHPAAIVPCAALAGVPGGFTRFAPFADGRRPRMGALEPFALAAGACTLLRAQRARPVTTAPAEDRRGNRPGTRASVTAALAGERIAIERIEPVVDDGRFAVKRVIGERLAVRAAIFADGHARLAAAVQWRAADENGWHEARCAAEGNDAWRADIPLERLGRHLFRVIAWRDDWATLVDEIGKKHAAGQAVALELEEARRLAADVLARAPEANPAALAVLREFAAALDAAPPDQRLALIGAPHVADAFAALRERAFATRDAPVFPVDVERRAARFASWYEMFPRSASDDVRRHGTFDDVVAHLPRIRDMGFDVLYFPPIHPIGTTARKGRNNSLQAAPDDVGSPYAIGSPAGGHTAVHPQLGSLDAFRRLVAAARAHDLEIALDFAVQCSPDHPWLTEHPGWFAWRPDGSLRYAENPPKRYQDIVNPDFYARDAMPALWIALRDVVLFWIDAGVRIFRVDNPHTKPLPFWAWMIADVRARHPDTVFLSEAFTRPSMMYRLAKLGFSQSYTYFTWRESKREFIDYLTELADGPAREYFRPNFFVNTPDINPRHLQQAPRTQFVIRAALAATLSGLWGMYSGFELCESDALPDSEEYRDAEKYELRARDWRRPGHIGDEIARLNRARRDNPALQTHLGIRFAHAPNDAVLVFSKATPAHDNVVVVAISLDPWHPQATDFTLDAALYRGWGIADGERLVAVDQTADHVETWHGRRHYVALDPHVRPFAIWRVAPAAGVARGARDDARDVPAQEVHER
ncbi:alpha amylase [Burkholderia pseudomallei]|nr:alpha-1,4-glucan--maltose-1-phosphate maltosyltransferase [Burkholderia pseudomallei]MWJ54573.1 DUF3416 domain-containing protein [Burkholderia pseudomallei]MXK58510.1 DUF3416 domain-containing protein [Burkholderia pseudomallei]MXN57873.1 DUF3416 domain-containing protein [Burkholderia pseudomallei]PNX03249.1 DUF3416 domain-containing protein [Burkholderia pseudomallei]